MKMDAGYPAGCAVNSIDRATRVPFLGRRGIRPGLVRGLLCPCVESAEIARNSPRDCEFPAAVRVCVAKKCRAAGSPPPRKRGLTMNTLWSERFAQRTQGMRRSEIRELLTLTELPGVISFGG